MAPRFVIGRWVVLEQKPHGKGLSSRQKFIPRIESSSTHHNPGEIVIPMFDALVYGYRPSRSAKIKVETKKI